MNDSWRVVTAGDSAFLVESAERIDEQISARVAALSAAIRAADIPGLRDVVPAYRSAAVYFDPLRTDVDALVRTLTALAHDASATGFGDARTIQVPVCYGGEWGPDLGEVAAGTQLTEQDVVDIHSSTIYRVFMLGFAPGFAYMGTVDSRIAVPRRATPRARVPPGSVAIAGPQTAVYSLATPGGWQIIGRTPLRLFDLEREPPFLFNPGDRVRFDPVHEAEYRRLAAGSRDAG